MELHIKKRKLAAVIKKYYTDLGYSRVRVSFSVNAKVNPILASNLSSDDPNDYYDVITKIDVFGLLETADVVYNFSERVDYEKTKEIILNTIDSNIYDVNNISFDDGVKYSFLTNDIYAFFNGVKLDAERKRNNNDSVVKVKTSDKS